MTLSRQANDAGSSVLINLVERGIGLGDERRQRSGGESGLSQPAFNEDEPAANSNVRHAFSKVTYIHALAPKAIRRGHAAQISPLIHVVRRINSRGGASLSATPGAGTAKSLAPTLSVLVP